MGLTWPLIAATVLIFIVGLMFWAAKRLGRTERDYEMASDQAEIAAKQRDIAGRPAASPDDILRRMRSGGL